MQRFWWVNHKQTFPQERAGGYLWSPKREAGGARSQFYDNMRLARAGDAVVSYANGRVRAVGKVACEAVNAPKPSAFGNVGQNWSNAGWLLPVAWADVAKEVKPSAHLQALAALFPTKYSPINPVTGSGNQKAYLAEISEPLFRAIIKLVEGCPGLPAPSLDVSAMVQAQEEAEVRALHENLLLSETERVDLIAARCGQGGFRDRLVARDRMCAVTAVCDIRMLRAGHIKPWRLCDSAAERLDECNGLLLTPTLDQMFDRGLVTFLGDGAVKVSSSVSAEDVARLRLHNATALYSLAHHEKYLQFHRNEIFIP